MLAAIGLLLALGAGWFAWDAATFFGRAVAVEGQVERLVQANRRPGRDAAWYPVFRWTAPDGTQREARSRVSSAFADWEPGRRVRLLVDPDADPPRAEADGLQLWLAPAILGGLAAVFLALGAALLRRR